MESRPDLELFRLLENIDHYFDFLSTRGFHMVSIIFVDQEYENWQVTMMTDECVMKIYCYQGKVALALSTLQLYNAVGFFTLDDLIYWVNGNKDLFDPLEEVSINSETQKIERLAWRLEKHIDNILGRIRKAFVLPFIDHPSMTSNNTRQLFHDN
jgi:hypothetical protein